MQRLGGGRSKSFSNLSAGGRPPKVNSRMPPSSRQQQHLLTPGGRTSSNSKSRSVENLVVGPSGAPVLGLKNANSEMNMLRRAASSKLLAGAKFGSQAKLKGTTSELQVESIEH